MQAPIVARALDPRTNTLDGQAWVREARRNAVAGLMARRRWGKVGRCLVLFLYGYTFDNHFL